MCGRAINRESRTMTPIGIRRAASQSGLFRSPLSTSFKRPSPETVTNPSLILSSSVVFANRSPKPAEVVSMTVKLIGDALKMGTTDCQIERPDPVPPKGLIKIVMFRLRLLRILPPNTFSRIESTQLSLSSGPIKEVNSALFNTTSDVSSSGTTQ
jgi:hypothetical protein